MSENLRDTVSKQISDLSGQRRSDLFKGLKDFSNVIAQRQADNRFGSAPLPQLVPTTSSSDMPSKGFSDSRPSGQQDPQQAQDYKKLEDIVVVLNGTGYYTNLITDGRLDLIT